MKRKNLSIRHEVVYHAAVCCQAASLSLTVDSLRGLKKTCLIERQKIGCGFASHPNAQGVRRSASCLGYSTSMTALSGYKDASIIGFLLDPHREQDSHPDISQSSEGHTVALALLAFAIIVVSRPLLPARVLCQAN